MFAVLYLSRRVRKILSPFFKLFKNILGDFMKTTKIQYLFLIALIPALFITQPGILYGQVESVVPKHAQALAALEEHFTFMISSDLGRNGYYDQKPVAEMMGVVASVAEPEFVAVLGDIHHFQGVRSV
jgi:hypothetical protein